MPCRAMTSAKFSPAAPTSTRTWPGPTTGSGRSWTARTSGPPNFVMTTARMAPTLSLEQPRRRHLGPPREERAVLDPADEHQHDAEEQHPDTNGDRHLDAGQGRRVVEVLLRVVVERLDEQRGHEQEAQQRDDPHEHEVARA